MVHDGIIYEDASIVSVSVIQEQLLSEGKKRFVFSRYVAVLPCVKILSFS